MPKPPYQTTAKQKRLKYRKLTWRIPRGFSRNWKQELRPGLWVPAGGAPVGNPLYGRASSAKPQRSAERGAQGSECRARGAARVSPRAQRNPAFPGPGGWCIVPIFGERGSQPVKGNLSLGKGRHAAKLELVGCRRLRGRGKGEMNRIISLSSPNPTKRLPMLWTIY